MSLRFFSALNLPSQRFSSDASHWPPHARVRTFLGQHVLWQEWSHGGRHLTAAYLEAYRQIGDDELDTILQLLARDGCPLRAGDDLFDQWPLPSAINNTAAPSSSSSSSSSSPSSSSSLSLTTMQAIAAFFERYSHLPDWVDWELVVQGRLVFLAYLAPIGLSLYYRSLVPGFSISKIAAVLQATGYLAPPSTRERVQARLEDTGAFLAACLAAEGDGGDPNASSLLPGGAGWKAALRVRVLHAKVRRALLHKKTWKAAELGIPINQEDMAATLLAFSTNALWGCEMILGRPLPRSERLAYLSFWRYVGWLLGVPVTNNHPLILGREQQQEQLLRPLDPCGPGWWPDRPDAIEHSHAMMQSIIRHLMQPDARSVQVAHHLLRIGRKTNETNLMRRKGQQAANDATSVQATVLLPPDPNHQPDNWFYFRALQCRRFIGDPLADLLQLPRHPVWYMRTWLWMASTVYLLLLRLYTVAALPWSPLRPRILRLHQRSMTSFFERWNASHQKRLQKQMNLNEESNNYDDDDDDDDDRNKKNGEKIKSRATMQGSKILPRESSASVSSSSSSPSVRSSPLPCPFAMVTAPS